MLEETRRVTLRTYEEMRGRGMSDASAFESALSVFRHRVPDMIAEDAQFIVADWISQELDQ